MNPFNFFDDILCISLPDRQDRRVLFHQETIDHNMGSYRFMNGIKEPTRYGLIRPSGTH